jgi:hypothetical protein
MQAGADPRQLALGLALALVAPAAGDAEDTVTEKKAQAKKKARDLKPGHKTAGDHVDDASDTAKEAVAKTKKGARKAGRKVKEEAHDATK